MDMTRVIAATVCILIVTSLVCSAKGRRGPARPPPTEANVAYGKHARNKLDFWKAESTKPTPVLVYFHGGGFKAGDKAGIHQRLAVKDYLDKGISCITVNYPFLEDEGHTYITIMGECKKAIDLIAANEKKWNIDTKRIGVSGASAGALISEWLGCWTSRISVMSVFLQPMGTDTLIMTRLPRSFPPLMINHFSSEKDKVHHPKYAKMLKAACDKKKIECVLWGTGKNGIPKSKESDYRKVMMDFLLKHWGMKKSVEK